MFYRAVVFARKQPYSISTFISKYWWLCGVTYLIAPPESLVLYFYLFNGFFSDAADSRQKRLILGATVGIARL